MTLEIDIKNRINIISIALLHVNMSLTFRGRTTQTHLSSSYKPGDPYEVNVGVYTKQNRSIRRFKGKLGGRHPRIDHDVVKLK